MHLPDCETNATSIYFAVKSADINADSSCHILIADIQLIHSLPQHIHINAHIITSQTRIIASSISILASVIQVVKINLHFCKNIFLWSCIFARHIVY